MGWNVTGVFWSVVGRRWRRSAAWITSPALPLSVTASACPPAGRRCRRPGVARQREAARRRERPAGDGEAAAARPGVTVAPVAVIEADPAKSGEVLGPLPASVADDVVIVYVPAGRATPFRVARRRRPSVAASRCPRDWPCSCPSRRWRPGWTPPSA